MSDLIVVLGYMGCGKTTIGKSLALKLNRSFVDLDHFIENKEQSTVREIFKMKGVIHFRKLERQALSEILESKEPKVIALGGGTPCYYDNMKLVNKKATSIYLQGTVRDLAKRLIGEKDQRPLIMEIQDLDELQEFIAKHIFERSPFYNEAKHTIPINGSDKDELTDRCIETLSK